MRNLFHSPQQQQAAQDYQVTTETEEPGQFYEGEAIPVHIASSDASPVKPVAPEFASCMSYPAGSVGQVGVSSPTQILPRRIHRYKATISLHGGAAIIGLWLNSNQEALMGANPQGWHRTVAATGTVDAIGFEWYSQQPLYAVCSGPDLEIDVIDQSFGEDER